MKEANASGENLFRGVHHPVSFIRRGKLFDIAKFVALYSTPDNPNYIETSVLWEKYAPTLVHVHACGCRMSARRNQIRAAGKGVSRNVYCGAYHFKNDHVRSLVGQIRLPEIREADLVHLVEDGEIAHANLHIQLANDIDNGALEGVKTAIIDHLWRASTGPIKHACSADQDIKPHPNSLMPVAPGGAYLDDRTFAWRLVCLFRFWVLSFFVAINSIIAAIIAMTR